MTHPEAGNAGAGRATPRTEHGERPLHDMGGDIGPADDAGREERRAERDPDPAGPRRRDAPIGAGDTANVAGNDEQQPHIAAGPTAGMQPGEEAARPDWQPPVEVDEPPGGTAGHGADGDVESRLRQKKSGGP